jgi:hypothetical protein
MATTAGDYARLLVAILNAEGKRKASVDKIVKSQIEIDSRQMFSPGVLERTGQYRDIRLAWGLGWGLFDSEPGEPWPNSQVLQTHHETVNTVRAAGQPLVAKVGVDVHPLGRRDLVIGGKLGGGWADRVHQPGRP